jgi:hypothetical protein
MTSALADSRLTHRGLGTRTIHKDGECPVFKAIALIVAFVAPVTAFAQGSSGTGSTSTGIGEPFGPAGPGIRGGGWTQQPGVVTNPARGPRNLSPSEKNSIPPPNAHPTNAQRFSR